MEAIIVFVIVFVVAIFVIRFFGSWLFRIDDVIKTNKEILQELKKMNKSLEGLGRAEIAENK